MKLKQKCIEKNKLQINILKTVISNIYKLFYNFYQTRGLMVSWQTNGHISS